MKKIIFDVDDTLWGLNKKICKKLHISYDIITTYSAYDNYKLTKKEQVLMLKEYGNPKMFQNISWFQDVEKLNELNADIYINSNSSNQECTNQKLKELLKILQIPKENIIINVLDNKEKIKEKRIAKDTYIFVDDSPYNILTSDAVYNFMLKQPWNQTEEAKKLISHKNVEFFDNFSEIIQRIQELIKE